jgi:hypothetical protein
MTTTLVTAAKKRLKQNTHMGGICAWILLSCAAGLVCLGLTASLAQADKINVSIETLLLFGGIPLGMMSTFSLTGLVVCILTGHEAHTRTFFPLRHRWWL